MTTTDLKTAWWEGPLAGFDLETTGRDPREARIVTACLVIDTPGQDPEPNDWIADPGVDIPDEAAAVHGITTEQARAVGLPAWSVVAEIRALLVALSITGTPVVIYNAQYDLTVLDRECRRHGLPPIDVRPVLDPFVIDKQVDRYRRGKRTLTDTARLYGVPLLDAHTATADALAAIGVARELGDRYGLPDAPSVHELQVGWKREQQTSLEAYFRKQGTLTEPVAKDWPLIPGDVS